LVLLEDEEEEGVEVGERRFMELLRERKVVFMLLPRAAPIVPPFWFRFCWI
jgi:hypothetical protein